MTQLKVPYTLLSPVDAVVAGNDGIFLGRADAGQVNAATQAAPAITARAPRAAGAAASSVGLIAADQGARERDH